MKIPREQLTIALKPASDILRAKATHDSPRYLKVEAAKGKLILSANDSNQSAVTEVECEGDLKPTLIQIANLQNIMPLFGDNVTMDAAEGKLKIRSSGNYSLSTADIKEFTAIPTEKMTKIGVNCEDLADCIDRVKFAARKEDSRVNLFGVNVRLSAKKIIAEAATGLVFAKMEKASIAGDVEFLIPFPFVNNFASNLRNAGAVLSVSENRISIAFDGGCYACQLLGVKFPQTYSKGLAEQKKAIGEIVPAEWLPIFRSVYSMSGEEGKLSCRVMIEDGRLKYEGPQGSVDTKISKLSKPLALNASTFIGCLESFVDGPCKAFFGPNDTLIIEQGDLQVATTQLRA